MSVYEQLAARLLNVEGFPLLLPPLSIKNAAGLCDEDDQRLCAVVCHLATGMSAERWDALSIEQRIGWMQHAVDHQEPQNIPADSPIESTESEGQLVTVAQIAEMVFREPGSIKTKHKNEWGPPDQPGAGRLPARWLLSKILPVLRRQFPGTIHPPEAT